MNCEELIQYINSSKIYKLPQYNNIYIHLGVSMRCAECKKPVTQIGNGIWYCSDCDKIIIDKKELHEEKRNRLMG